EDGVGNAIQAIYRDLEYAKTLVRQRSNATSASQTGVVPVGMEESSVGISSTTGLDADGDDEGDADADVAMEDSWTFVGDEAGPELARKSRARERDCDVPADVVAARVAGSNGSSGSGSHDGRSG
ncbi:hypothetical protein ACJ73_09370, partial [Blastomyces percursus]